VLEKLGLDAVVVHIHFGMSGSFRTFPYPGKFTFFLFFFFLSFFLPESEEIAGSACSEGCRRRDDGLMQQQTLEMMTQIGSFRTFQAFWQ
jgi:hypothetical protein